MPHEIVTESNSVGVVISFSGVVSGAELIDLNRSVVDDQSFSQCRYQVWDLSKVTRLDVTIEDLRSISQQDIAASGKNPNLRIAIVGSQELFGGKDQIFRIYEEVWTTYRPKFFSDVEAAKEWATGDDP
jgi:hypothetical protein